MITLYYIADETSECKYFPWPVSEMRFRWNWLFLSHVSLSGGFPQTICTVSAILWSILQADLGNIVMRVISGLEELFIKRRD